MKSCLGIAVAVVFALCAVGVSSAAAVVAQFGSKGKGAGQFDQPHGLAIDQESGDVYLADASNNRIESFGPEGDFRFALGWGVLNGEAALQVCTTTCRAGISGGGAGQFDLPDGVAVDNNPASKSFHDIYVVDAGNHRVQKFDAAGHFLRMFGSKVNSNGSSVCVQGETCNAGSQGTEPGELQFPAGALAVDSKGLVYVGDAERVQEFTEAGAYSESIALPGVGLVLSLAVNSSDDLYVAAEVLTGVHEYGALGSEIGTPIDAEGSPRALTIGPADEVFIDNGPDIGFEAPHLVEYSSAGQELASFDTGSEGGGRGIAFGDNIARTYVLNAETVRLVATPPSGPLLVPESEGATEVKPTTATLNALIDAEGNNTTFHFDYGTDTTYGQSAPGGATLTGFENSPANAQLSNLQPETLYHFRVVAEDEHGNVTVGPDATFETLPTALIDSESATQVTTDSARLGTTINPLGTATSYHFDYGLSTAYEHHVPVPDASAGSGLGDVAEGIVIEKLRPDTTYHYRVVAQNTVQGTLYVQEGEDRTFTTSSVGAFTLADGRQWEMVSPPAKGGVSLEAISEEGGLIQASADGSALTYIAKGPVDEKAPGSQSALDSQLFATRGAAGWSTLDITPPHEEPAGFTPGVRADYPWFSSDLSKGVVEPAGATPLKAPPPGETQEKTPYLREHAEYVPLLTTNNVPSGVKFGGVEGKSEEFLGSAHVMGATDDLSHLIVESPAVLTSEFTIPSEVAETVGEVHSLYAWNAGALKLVSVLPDGHAAAEEGVRSELGFRSAVVRHAVSREGTRVVFEGTTQTPTRHLYLRDVRLDETVQLDMPSSGISGSGGDRQFQFQDASASGDKIFFTDEERLTPDATGENGRADLYECEVQETVTGLACSLTNMTVPLHVGEPADVLGSIVGADEAGRYVYFVANGALTADAVKGDCSSEVNGLPSAAPRCNLYMYDTTTGETRLVAVLSEQDFSDWSGRDAKDLGGLTARVSPNGRYLAFMSQRSLTGYDNTDAHSGAADEEVFRYDATYNDLTCVSCAPTGARPSGVFDTGHFPGLLVDRPQTWGGQWLAGSLPGWTRVDVRRALYQSRYLTNDGRVFFNSSDALVPQDVNGQEDVYEYEPDGLGTCHREAGCVALLSSGTSSREAAFLDTGAEGHDAFFLTDSRLSPTDVDSELDVYDAHACSSESPCVSQSTSTVQACESTESCRGTGGTPEGIVSASPAIALGSGNIAPAAAKPTVRPPTRAQLLAKALRVCRKQHGKGKRRKACEARARHRYGIRHLPTRRQRRRK
jgi:hypothetical protein